MVDRTTRLRWRRRIKHSRTRVEDMGVQAEEQLERHLFRRLNKLVSVRRFITAWLLFIVLLLSITVVQIRNLGKYYLMARPVPGGTVTEGIVGAFTNANPLYANTPVDNSVSKLLFGSLLKYNENHALVTDLASSYTVNDTATVYTVTLLPDLKWHDGYPLTAADVTFTYASIQNPDAKSPLYNSWRGITVVAKDSLTIEFTLPSPLSSFPFSLTTGIVPRHLLSGIPASQLRSISFNTQNPVGSGPFTWEAIEVSGSTPEDREQRIGLDAYQGYHAGKPKLNKFIIRTFLNEQRLRQSFDSRELNAMAGLNKFPEEYNKSLEIEELNVPLLSQVMIFLRNSHEILSNSQVRRALTQATDKIRIIDSLGYPVIPSQGPLLESQIGFSKDFVQLPFDPDSASRTLDAQGWVMGSNGIREKDGITLSFGLYSLDNEEYRHIVEALAEQWRAVGIDAKVVAQSDSELQTTISIHSYDALVYGISMGVDPDVFAYWHSSQASVLAGSRTNLSEYSSTKADDSLEAGRTRTDAAIRTIKYRPFLEAWRDDAPAIALYQPRFLYITRGTIHGLNPKSMTSRVDRYANVANWMIREERQSDY